MDCRNCLEQDCEECLGSMSPIMSADVSAGGPMTKHKPDCAVSHPESGKPWFMSCTCSAGTPPICPHDGEALRPQCGHVPCVHHSPGKVTCALAKPTPPATTEAETKVEAAVKYLSTYFRGSDGPLEQSWHRVHGAFRATQVMLKSARYELEGQRRSHAPAPTGDEVREALEYLTDFRHSLLTTVGPEFTARIDILLAALDWAEGEGAPHPDDLAVDAFSAAMKAKLAQKRDEGRGGWDNPEACTIEFLVRILHRHIWKGDPVDIGNICMMLWNRGVRRNTDGIRQCEDGTCGILDALLRHADVAQSTDEQNMHFPIELEADREWAETCAKIESERAGR